MPPTQQQHQHQHQHPQQHPQQQQQEQQTGQFDASLWPDELKDDAQRLASKGLRSMKDLKYCTEEQLRQWRPPITVNKLLAVKAEQDTKERAHQHAMETLQLQEQDRNS